MVGAAQKVMGAGFGMAAIMRDGREVRPVGLNSFPVTSCNIIV
jgi:hypothetical protein